MQWVNFFLWMYVSVYVCMQGWMDLYVVKMFVAKKNNNYFIVVFLLASKYWIIMVTCEPQPFTATLLPVFEGETPGNQKHHLFDKWVTTASHTEKCWQQKDIMLRTWCHPYLSITGLRISLIWWEQPEFLYIFNIETSYNISS